MRAYNFTSAFSKILGLQTAFKSTLLSPTFFRPMSSISTMDTDINRTLSYWFDGPEAKKKWYGGGEKIDTEIRDQFGPLMEQARASELNSWESKPRGSLALLILLDQFSRNAFRSTPDSFSADSLALDIATKAIAKGFNLEVSNIQQIFFLMPFMHSETLLGQVAGVSLFEALLARCDPNSKDVEFLATSVQFARRHREPILRFGRFPSRNEILGRTSTPEEIEFLKEHPGGF
ncbi:DUF924-domain-containing protein [Mollisia scopiformis]|uniref:DUF924-domain-containing protein n=1 Tax=Mollisia scopiformis TaxID=149040 RepID=A0A132B976_MOLSC|nr:DUF924-domain-containing protein [Mollisia scopiformis]KUJ08227.1 DUF924-domain-containing protein [Mollisia scopiformis]